MKFLIRKNKIVYANHKFHIGKATQIINLFDNLSFAMEEYKPLMKNVINQIMADGLGIETAVNKSNYNLYKYRNIINKGKKLNEILSYQVANANIDNRRELHMTLESHEEVDFFNMLYPTSGYEIIFTNENYLISPYWNPDYFKSKNIKPPESKLTFDETISMDGLALMGLFTDELDFWLNLEKDMITYPIVQGQFVINNAYKELSTKDQQFESMFILKNEHYRLRFPSATDYWHINNNLDVPPILFEKVALSNSRNFEKANFKKLVIELYLSMRQYTDHDFLMDDPSVHFGEELSLSEDFAKEIINDNLEEVLRRAGDIG